MDNDDMNDVHIEAINRFKDSTRETGLLVTGAWGVGKTWTVDQVYQFTKAENNDEKVIYLSLYGVGGTQEFEVKLLAAVLKSAPSTEDKSVFRKVTSFAEKYVSHILENKVSEGLLSNLVENITIIIDDVERRGPDYPISKLFSVISHFQDIQNCRVIVICNSDELEAADLEALAKSRDKVFNRTIKIEKETSVLLEIAGINELTSDHREILRTVLSEFEIQNVRLLRTIISDCARVLDIANDFPKPQKELLVSQCTIVSLCRAQAPGWPPLKDLLEDETMFSAYMRHANSESPTWPNLDKHNYQYTTDLELEIATGIERGYFDEERLRTTLSTHTPFVTGSETQVGKAWLDFHHSFTDEREFIEQMKNAQRDFAEQIDVHNFVGALSLLKELNQEAVIPELIENYVKAHDRQDIEFFDLDTHMPLQLNGLQLFKDAFDIEFNRRADQFPLDVVLKEITEEEGLARAFFRKLAITTPKDLANEILGTSLNAKRLISRLYLLTLTLDSNIIEQRDAIQNINDAFEIISASSTLNAIRMRSFKK